jgi:hypothetical protein
MDRVLTRLDYAVLTDKMTDELERIWKKAAVALLRYYPDICLQILRNTKKSQKAWLVFVDGIKLSTFEICIYSATVLPAHLVCMSSFCYI